MNVQRFAVVVVILLVVTIVIAAVRIYNAPEPPTTCLASQQEVVLEGFKGDVIVFGLLAAGFGLLLYVAMLRYQAYFPASDIRRIATAAGGACALGLALAFADYFVGSDCLARAVGPGSGVPDLVAPLGSLAGNVVGYLWLAIGIDHLLMALVAIGIARLYRQLSLQFF